MELVTVLLPGGSGETAQLEANQPGSVKSAIVANGIQETEVGWRAYFNSEDVSDQPIAKMGGRKITILPEPGEGGKSK